MIVEPGEIDELGDALSARIRSGHLRFVVNLGEVETISRLVVDTLAMIREECVTHGGMLKLCEIQGQVGTTFAESGKLSLFPIYSDLEEAILSDWPDPRTPRTPR